MCLRRGSSISSRRTNRTFKLQQGRNKKNWLCTSCYRINPSIALEKPTNMSCMFVLILLFTRRKTVAWKPIVSCGVKADLEVSAVDEIMLCGVCQQHYLTSLSLISRAQGGAYLFVRSPL